MMSRLLLENIFIILLVLQEIHIFQQKLLFLSQVISTKYQKRILINEEKLVCFWKLKYVITFVKSNLY